MLSMDAKINPPLEELVVCPNNDGALEKETLSMRRVPNVQKSPLDFSVAELFYQYPPDTISSD